LFDTSDLITLVAYLCPQRKQDVQIKFFMFDSSIYGLFVPNTSCKRDSLQMMIFVIICPTLSIVELKTLFFSLINKNEVKRVSLLHLCYLIILMIYLCSQWTSNLQIKYFMFDWSINRIFVLNRAWKRDALEKLLFVYVSSTWSIGELKTCFEAWITRKDLNGESLLHLSYLVTLMAYLCSHTSPKVQIKYFMFDWSIYRFLVLFRCWKCNSFQITTFVYVCSTWSIVELKTRFETWITRNDVNDVLLFHLS
jgi:hypothetical protein